MFQRWRRIGGAAVLLAIVVTMAYAQAPRSRTTRVRPKEFSRDEVERVFFDDVFEVLVGERPTLRGSAAGSTAATGTGPNPSSAPASSDAPAETAPSGAGWSQVISATTIEDEIKLLKRLVDQSVTTPGEFKGRGYLECRQHFSIAAMLFGIIQEYDGEVRWKESAAQARDVFARSAANAKVGTTPVFNEAKLRKTDLEDLINGARLVASKPPPAENDWANIADRGPLMRRLEQALDGNIKQFVSNEHEFVSNSEKLIHEAEIVAAISVVLTQAGMEDGDDETHAEYARQMQSAAQGVVEGIKKNDYDFSRKNVGAIDQACSVCHESYRG